MHIKRFPSIISFYSFKTIPTRNLLFSATTYRQSEFSPKKHQSFIPVWSTLTSINVGYARKLKLDTLKSSGFQQQKWSQTDLPSSSPLRNTLNSSDNWIWSTSRRSSAWTPTRLSFPIWIRSRTASGRVCWTECHVTAGKNSPAAYSYLLVIHTGAYRHCSHWRQWWLLYGTCFICLGSYHR